jgi:hypothetical protein
MQIGSFANVPTVLIGFRNYNEIIYSAMKKTGLFLISFLIFSCTQSLPVYYGRTYPSTHNVDIFMCEADIKRPYEAMGKVVYEELVSTSSERVQNNILTLAKTKGADAVVFEEVDLTHRVSKPLPGYELLSDSMVTMQVVKVLLVKYKKG